MKRIVLFVLVIALFGIGIVTAALVSKGRTEAITTKVNIPTNMETVEPTTPSTTNQQPEEPEESIPMVFGQDIFPNGTIVLTQDDFVQGYLTNSQGDYLIAFYSDRFDQNKEYGFAWAINPRVLDIENLSFLTHNDRPAIFYYIGDWNAAISDGTNYMQTIISSDLQYLFTNHVVFETGSDETEIMFCPFLLSGLSEAPGKSLVNNIFSYVLLSVFELPAE